MKRTGYCPIRLLTVFLQESERVGDFALSAELLAISDDDEVSRLVFRPKDYLDGVGPLSLSKSLYFQSKDEYKESVNCNRFVRSFPQDLHQQGYEKAQRDTGKRAKEGKPAVTYEGFCPIHARTVRSVNEGEHRFGVNHSPTNDNMAHCDIQLQFPGQKPMTAQKNLAIQKLADGFSDPVSP